MHLLLTILLPLLGGVVILLLPGALLLAVTRTAAVVPPALLPAAALVTSLVPLAACTAVALGVHAQIRWVTFADALICLVCWAWLSVRAHRAEPGHGYLRACGAPARSLARAHAREIPRGALLAAAATGLVAMVVGFYAWNDSIYHIAQAQKLLHLAHPSFDNTLQFPDGSAHPGYLLPVWHEALAQVALLGRVDPVTAAWVLPFLTVAVAALAFGGLVATLTDLPRAATPGTVAWGLVACLAPLPFSDGVINAMHPGTITLTVITPLVLALILRAVRPVLPSDTRRALVVALPAIAIFGILHVSNLALLALGMLGYLLLWVLTSRRDVRRHAVVFGSIALVAALCVGALLPGLTNLDSYGKDAAGELARNDTDLYEGKNAVDLDALLRGDVAAERYHLRADYLVLGGGLSLLALFALVPLPLVRRWPGTGYVAGAGILAIGISQSDLLFPHFVDVVSLDQARRIEKSLPLAPALAMTAVGVALVWDHLRSRGTTLARLAAGGVVGASAALVWLVTGGVDVLDGYGGHTTVDRWLVLLAGGLLALSTLVAVVRSRTTREHDAAEQVLPTGVITVATLLLLVAVIPTAGRFTELVDSTRIAHLPVSQRAGELRILAKPVVQQLRALPVGSTALLDPRTREAYVATAVAPIYVVSSSPRHTAQTPANRVAERYHLAVSFYDDSLGDPERIQLLLDQHVRAVVVASDSPLRDGLLANTPGITLGAKGYSQWLYRVDLRELAEAQPN